MKQRKSSELIWAFFIIFGVAFATRLPYFFKSNINWDESTFLLLGQSVLDGHLPYTFLIDNKPPFLWYCFAIIIFFCGKSFFGIRAVGALCVAIASYLNYASIRALWGHRSGLIVSIFLINLINLNAGGQAFLSEHLALVPLAGSFTLLLFFPRQKSSLFTAGLLLSIAAAIRLNLAYAAVSVGLYLLFWPREGTTLKARFSEAIVFGFGSLPVILSISIPYVLSGEFDVLYGGAIEAPLRFSGDQMSPPSVLRSQIGYAVDVLFLEVTIALALIGIVTYAILGRNIFWISRHFRRFSALQKRAYLLAAVFFISIEFSIIRSGVFHDHYNIQLSFFISLLAAAPYKDILRWGRSTPILQLLGLTAIAGIAQYLLQYISVADVYLERGTPFYGRAFEIAEVIEEENPNKLPVWIHADHLAYWLMDIDPVIPSVTHPSSIRKTFLLQAWYGEEASSRSELEKIITKQPILIVSTVSHEGMRDYFPNDRDAQARLEDYVKQEYEPIEVDDSILRVYKRRETISKPNIGP